MQFKTFQLIFLFILFCGLNIPKSADAGNQDYEELSSSVKTLMSKNIIAPQKVNNSFTNLGEAIDWLSEMKIRISKFEKNIIDPIRLLQLIHYEASRAGVDPQLVLAIIEVESGFKRYAVSSAGARGMMQVMPFWVKSIGSEDHNLFDLETNIRYGSVILRHYLDIEKGNLFRALGRYNGSTGKSQYPNMVLAAMKRNWNYSNKNNESLNQANKTVYTNSTTPSVSEIIIENTPPVISN